ncbi:uncharacterized protein BT62DRAFT_1073164 [Guyanagaster necrorhizus]|uniref:PinX1-related protein 1 n=1 Tax=Guyanagaster necrorhizus TaxID=856835 RepID=A0A9P7VZQ7_9AGAR|nr:uncharacterized protein BT62DRAFT_1073164 [Guyanagaster necrorhizus MCA 3950]KAG7449740.1 hypothetical protein BT62DRAFT_1073164 [Guyanagaster necrorhizus MCA 3950]
MGLSGRKVKQRISADPRNLSWADDASKFGATYLSKFGWSSSQGLGVSGEGRTSHIKVSQKLDMMGIGAAHQKDPNGIAWKQNRDFENVLMRLNAAQGGGEDVEEQFALAGQFISESKVTDDGGSNEKKTKKKEKNEKKRQREEKGDEESKKKAKKAKAEPADAVEESVVPAAKPLAQRALPRHLTHRARAIAAKNRAAISETAMSEILGISQSATPQLSTPVEGEEPPTLETLTVSTKSVADYFKERLLSKSGKSTPAEWTDEEKASRGGSSQFTSASGKPTPAELEPPNRTDEDDLHRGGIGSFKARPTSDGDDAPRIGIGMSKFSSLISSSFLAATSTSVLSSTPLDGDGGAEPESMRTVKEKKRKDRQDKQDGDKGGIHRMEMESEGGDDKKVEKKRRKEAKKRKQEEDVGPAPDADVSADKKLEKKMRKVVKNEQLEHGGPALENKCEVKLSKEERKREKEKKRHAKLTYLHKIITNSESAP